MTARPDRGTDPVSFPVMQLPDLLGYVAASLTTASFVPQAHLTWKTRRAHGVSLGMYTLFTAGIAFWLIYGIAIGAWPVIVANAITLSLAVFILWMRLRFGP